MVVKKTKSNTKFTQIEPWLLGHFLPSTAYAHQRLSKAALSNNRSRIVTTVHYYL